MLLTMKIMLKF